MTAPTNPTDPRKAAKLLLKELRAGDPSAVKRARTILYDLAELPDWQVPEKMTLMRCQHVIAKEREQNNWSGLQNTLAEQVSYQVVGISGTRDLSMLQKAAAAEPEKSMPRRMMSDISNSDMGYRAIGTLKQCEDLIAWSFQVLPPSARTKTRLGDALRIERIKPDDDDWHDPDLHYINDLDAPGEL